MKSPLFQSSSIDKIFAQVNFVFVWVFRVKRNSRPIINAVIFVQHDCTFVPCFKHKFPSLVVCFCFDSHQAVQCLLH